MHILPTGIFQTGGHATHTHDAHGSTYTVLSLERNNTGTQVCAKSTCSCAPNWQASMLCGCHGSPSFRHTAFSAVNACCLHVLILWRALVFDISRKRPRCDRAVQRLWQDALHGVNRRQLPAEAKTIARCLPI